MVLGAEGAAGLFRGSGVQGLEVLGFLGFFSGLQLGDFWFSKC